MSLRHDIERNRFIAKHGDLPLLKTADLIAEGKWFSWKLCKQRLRGVDRKDGLRLLRQAAKARTELEPDAAWLHALLQSKRDFVKAFVTPLVPEVYHNVCQPVVLGEKRIGVTISAERVTKNRARVYYTSTLNTQIEWVGCKIIEKSTEGEKALGIRTYQTIFKVKEKGRT